MYISHFLQIVPSAITIIFFIFYDNYIHHTYNVVIQLAVRPVALHNKPILLLFYYTKD